MSPAAVLHHDDPNKRIHTFMTNASKPPQENITTVGMIGLGIMGSAMSANLVKAGFDVYGYDPLPKMCARLKKAGGHACSSAQDVALSCDYIVLSLPSEAALDAVCQDLIAAKRKGLVVAETSTLPEAAKKRALAVLAKHSITLIDCRSLVLGRKRLRSTWLFMPVVMPKRSKLLNPCLKVLRVVCIKLVPLATAFA
jgi:hypothetical protein